jgi:hypothetical protein
VRDKNSLSQDGISLLRDKMYLSQEKKNLMRDRKILVRDEISLVRETKILSQEKIYLVRDGNALVRENFCLSCEFWGFGHTNDGQEGVYPSRCSLSGLKPRELMREWG